MKKVAIVLVFLFFLVSCQKKSPLPSEEVLKRTAIASQELASARYIASVKLASGKTGGSGVVKSEMDVSINGRMQEGGLTEVNLDIDGNVSMFGLPSLSSIRANLDIVVTGREEVYLRIQSIESDQSLPMFPSPLIKELKGEWWRLHELERKPISSSITPDPRLLYAQSQVVYVTKDRGIERYDDNDVYHYDVIFDSEKFINFLREMKRLKVPTLSPDSASFDVDAIAALLLGAQAKGQLWIDAQSFVLRRIEWNIFVETKQYGAVDAFVSIHFFDHGDAPPIFPPKGAKLFLPSVSLNSPDLLNPMEKRDDDSGEISQKLEKEILDALLEEGQ